VREQLFVAAPGGAPRIADYAGNGALRSWLVVTATRAAFRLLRDARRTPGGTPAAVPDIADDEDVELACLRRRHGADLEASLRDGFAALTARDRNLLRLSILDGLGIDPIADLHGIHRSTASRWLARARASYHAAVRAALQRRLALPDSQLDTVLRALGADLELTAERILAA
jgi:RNA polymerase sigma-70 factor (ECF subfamily)